MLGRVEDFQVELQSDRRDAQRKLDELLTLERERYVPPHLIAIVHASLGQNDQPFGWMAQAVETRDANIVWLNVAPHYDGLREDPLFEPLLRKMNFFD